ncbi:hypothetical protein SteCoe_26927 [Stentor coeruleus]|uniref:G-protein coupled receptors family 2 profile 2 domain-containing protein n=1 Tax=Stentor coeruleus TaxID=5963 RepID=A0A1R2BBR0_9CILI|nr:hypothetical protein SteCoe_26927 [Stentor coeruleus]
MANNYDGYISSCVFSSISATACSYALFLNYRRNKLLRTTESNLILILTLFYLLASIFSLIPGPIEGSITCKAQTALVVFTALGGILWTGYIALYMYIKCYKENSGFYNGILIPVSIVLLFCTLSTALPLGFDDYGHGPGSGWCWIKVSGDHQKRHLDFVFVYVLYYIPVWIVIFWNMYAYIKIIKKVNEQFRTSEGKELSRSLIWYPFIAFVFYLPQSLSRFIETGHYSQRNDIPLDFTNFKIFACCWIRLLGFANSVAYGITGHFQARQNYSTPPTVENNIKNLA